MASTTPGGADGTTSCQADAELVADTIGAQSTQALPMPDDLGFPTDGAAVVVLLGFDLAASP